MWQRYGIYLIRWQLSTPILAPIIAMVKHSPIWGMTSDWVGAGIANLVGGLIFFWVDRFIFTTDRLGSVWHIRENNVCVDCGKVGRGYRLVKSANYNKTTGKSEYRCEECSIKKAKELKAKGVELYK